MWYYSLLLAIVIAWPLMLYTKWLSGWEKWTCFLLYLPVFYWGYNPIWLGHGWLAVIGLFLSALPALPVVGVIDTPNAQDTRLGKFGLKYIHAWMYIVVPLTVIMRIY